MRDFPCFSMCARDQARALFPLYQLPVGVSLGILRARPFSKVLGQRRSS